MLLLEVTFTLNESRLEQIEAFVLVALDFVLTRIPFAVLLLLHQTSSQDETSFVRGGRQSVLESFVFSHLLNEVHLDHGGRQATTEFVVSNVEDLRNVLGIDGILRREGVSLGLRLSEDSLHFCGFGAWLLVGDFGRFDALLRDLHHTIKRQVNQG